MARDVVKSPREFIRISWAEFNGETRFDIRTHTMLENGTFVPTKKGISLPPELLPEFMAALELVGFSNG